MGDGLDPQLLSRARGALLGLVAGNQLAAPTQHLGTPEAIRQAVPDGVWDLPPSPPGPRMAMTPRWPPCSRNHSWSAVASTRTTWHAVGCGGWSATAGGSARSRAAR